MWHAGGPWNEGIIIMCMLGSNASGFALWLLWLLLMPSIGMLLVAAALVLARIRHLAFQFAAAGHLQAATLKCC